MCILTQPGHAMADIAIEGSGGMVPREKFKK